MNTFVLIYFEHLATSLQQDSFAKLLQKQQGLVELFPQFGSQTGA